MSDPKINEPVEAAIERIKQPTEMMLAAASTAGTGVLQAYQKALQGARSRVAARRVGPGRPVHRHRRPGAGPA